jgi:hypothetical protein
MPARKATARGDVKAKLDALKGLAEDPEAQAELAISYLRDSKNMEVLRPALTVLQGREDPSLRPLLHETYAWCARAPERNDSGGVVRAAVIRALRPTVHVDDLPILREGLVSYQAVGMYDVTAELRVAALVTLNDLDPNLAALYAARFLHDPRNSNSGEPALTSIRLLAAQQVTPALFAYAAWPGGNGELLGEALRNLVDLPAEMVPFLIETHGRNEDEQVLLGLYDLLLGHLERARWTGVIEGFLRSTRLLDLFGLVATQIVVTRDQDLIDLLRRLAAEETDRVRYELLTQALEHA